jgi:hypothetical protein
VGLKEKIVKVLRRSFPDAYVRLDEDDGISGFLVSPKFTDMSTIDRQALIEQALGSAPDGLTAAEQRQVLMIAGITPQEFDSVGPRIRVHRIREIAGGTVEIVLHGRLADAEYVRGALKNQKGVETTEPKESPGGVGVLMYFRAKGTAANPLTKAKAVRVLKADPYIEVMPNS